MIDYINLSRKFILHPHLSFSFQNEYPDFDHAEQGPTEMPLATSQLFVMHLYE